MDNRLPREEILQKKRDFERVLFHGKQLRASPVVLYYAPSRAGSRRIAFITSGRFQTNVTRNRVKRRLRELFRTNKGSFQPGFDFILRGTPEVADIEFAALRETVLKLADTIKERMKSEL